ncbi:E3 SUMO- ligase 2-like, partial [Brachionus plicatilis]
MMFKTKFELDKHVGKILMRARTDSDKNKEGLKIAKLYFDIKEYETADFYLTNYLSEFTFDSFAWKLKAEIAEMSEKNWTKAIDYYIKSFKSNDESDSKLLLKICNCFIQTEKFDFVKAKEWLDRAIKMFPNDKIIINLQEKLFNNIELLGEKELNQWETFLIDAINENCSDQEVNLKFINISLKSKNYSKAFKHLIKIEYKSLFERDSKWSGFLFNLINSYIENQEEFNKFDKSTKLIFYLMAINYITSQIFGSIQKDDLLVLKQNFLRLDKFITKFESEKLLNLNENFGKIVYNEIISQYLYILGLLFLKHETNETDDMSPDEKIFSNETKA